MRSAPEAVSTLFANVEPLLRDADDVPSDVTIDDEDFAEEQNLAAALVGVLWHDDVDSHFALLNAARKVRRSSSFVVVVGRRRGCAW